MQGSIELATTGVVSGLENNQDANIAFEAITTWLSGNSAPNPTYPNMVWVDTANSLIKQRDNADSAWIVRAHMDRDAWGLMSGWSTSDSGTADALVVAPSLTWSSLSSGHAVLVKKNSSANATTAPTLAVSGLTA